VAVTATLVSLPFGFAAAYILTYAKFRGKFLLEALVNLPLTLPPVVVGYLLLLCSFWGTRDGLPRSSRLAAYRYSLPGRLRSSLP
jgi:ABC-type molybdate transport system permease subunit